MSVPDEIRQFVSNARYYLEAADKFPSPTKDAAQILLLTISWENIIIADKKLHGWAVKEKLDPKLLRSHEAKLDEISKDSHILRVIVEQPGKHIPVKKVKYETGAQLQKLREICQYGADDETHELATLFYRGWHSDSFRRSLHNKIEWTELTIRIYEELEQD
ncbi:MAG TPA: hypothetical protein VFN56_01990 [Candidatus Saccharimonadales bacterium]|nr:hypothetical protein [Candidatus Saccharimonadales bacterium]